MVNLAIKGHATRGKEVIEILEMLGGKNEQGHCGHNPKVAYYISHDKNTILCDCVPNIYLNIYEYVDYTLEEFLEKFPYKVGDKVQYKGATSCGSVYKVEKLRWEDNRVEYIVSVFGNGSRLVFTAEDLQPFEEETMEKKLEQITLDIPDGYEFFGINDDNKVVLTKKQSQYPKNYDECCMIIGFNSDTLKLNNPFSINRDTHPYIKHLDNLIESFCKLLICRDAYWKIAGEQMGLGKPWKPDWDGELSPEHHYVYIKKGRFQYSSYVLVFPTKEMRDMFYENFKELIEDCKEIL